MSEKKLGVIGGMGPLATQFFYKMIIDKTDAKSDQEHIDMIIVNHAGMPDRTTAILAGDITEVKGRLLEDAKFLADAGCDYIAVPCNTSHYMLDMIAEEVPVPFVHMIYSTIDVIKEKYPAGSKVGVLATDGTIKTALYQTMLKEAGYEPIVPNAKDQKIVMSVIYDGVKDGGPIDIEGFMKVAGDLKDEGACCVLTACTELSCVKEQYKLSDFYLDPMAVMAEKAITLCGKNVKK